MKNPANRSIARNTSPNSARGFWRRLASLAFWSLLPLAAGLALVALAGRDEALMRGAWTCVFFFLALLLTRRWWRTAASDDGQTGARPVVPAANVSPTALPRVLLIDASLAGPGGNSARLLDMFSTRLGARAVVERMALSGQDAKTFAQLEPALRAADAFVFATGTHWDSWSSSLQKFLEDATPAEASALWLGKPAAVLVTEHSVGGKAVLSRLQGVLVTLGCTLPPLSGLVISKAAQLAGARPADSAATKDFWAVDDLAVVADNLLTSIRKPAPHWSAWPVDRADYRATWLRPD